MLSEVLLLQSKLVENMWQEGVTCYSVLENNNTDIKTIYNLSMLEMGIHGDDIVFFTDEDDMLLSSDCLLKHFLISSIEQITISNKIIEIFLHNNEYIKIEKL